MAVNVCDAAAVSLLLLRRYGMNAVVANLLSEISTVVHVYHEDAAKKVRCVCVAATHISSRHFDSDCNSHALCAVGTRIAS